MQHSPSQGLVIITHNIGSYRGCYPHIPTFDFMPWSSLLLYSSSLSYIYNCKRILLKKKKKIFTFQFKYASWQCYNCLYTIYIQNNTFTDLQGSEHYVQSLSILDTLRQLLGSLYIYCILMLYKYHSITVTHMCHTISWLSINLYFLLFQYTTGTQEIYLWNLWTIKKTYSKQIVHAIFP